MRKLLLRRATEEFGWRRTTFSLVVLVTLGVAGLIGLWQGETGAINHSMLTKYVDDLQSPIYYIAGLPEMTSAMRKLLADAGVNEENIQAEEFSGFDLNRLSDVA